MSAVQQVIDLQRERAIVLKSRNMQQNRIRAIVAGTLGYHSRMKDKERKAKFKEADAVIRAVVAGTATHRLQKTIEATLEGIDAFNGLEEDIKKRMERAAKSLPVAAWVEQPEQDGFGLLSLATVIGETGDLNNYANPAKVWRRLGCAPWTFDGQTLMGSTWKSGKEGRLPALEWEQFGYSPRRRSIAYLIGENFVRLNGEGPYRRRYDETKARAAETHPDWKPKRCHLHGMLLATKLLLKNLWLEWTGKPVVAWGTIQAADV